MIVLEFRFQEIFQNASGLLKKHRILCECESSQDEWRPSFIFLFEDAVRTEPQREALRRARSLEKEDRRHRNILQEPNLAVPL